MRFIWSCPTTTPSQPTGFPYFPESLPIATITISLLDKNGEVVADPEILTRSFGELYSEDDNDVIFFTRKASPASVVKFKYVVMMNNEVIEQGEDVIGDLL